MIYPPVDYKVLKRVYKKRAPWSHKGENGKLLIVGGSNEYTGAPALVALAAMRGGCDVAKIISCRRCADACAAYSPEIMSNAVDHELGMADFDAIKSSSERVNVIELGNGLGTSEDKKELVNSIVRKLKTKFVVDADAIKMLYKENLNRSIVITPNSNEFSIIFGVQLGNNVEERVRMVESKAREYNTTILLKGHVDVISDGEETRVNKINSVYMTKAGTGDVLAGICAGLLAQKNTAFDSASAAAFINGYTGRSLSRALKESLSPIDLINGIGTTITKFRTH